MTEPPKGSDHENEYRRDIQRDKNPKYPFHGIGFLFNNAEMIEKSVAGFYDMKAISTIVLSFIACSVLASCNLRAQANQSLESRPPSPVELAGTHWRLVEFQSMDDSKGTKKPTDPGAYTMDLMAGGRVAFRLDCNRGMGNWSVEPSADGTSGTISFSHLAVTKAMCPPPSMGEKLALDTQYMRGYLLRDGRLNISLMADGGIYVWEPAS